MGTGDEPILIFSEAVSVALQEMASVGTALRDSTQTTGGEFSGITALLHLQNEGTGYLVLCCPELVAAELARRVYAQVGVQPDAVMIRDCVGEVANVIAGQAKTRLYGTPHHFTLSPPELGIVGPPEPDAKRWMLTFASEIGEFTVHVRLPAAAW